VNLDFKTLATRQAKIIKAIKNQELLSMTEGQEFDSYRVKTNEGSGYITLPKEFRKIMSAIGECVNQPGLFQ